MSPAPLPFDKPPPLHLRPSRLLTRALRRGPGEVAGLALARAREGWRASDALIFYVKIAAGAPPPAARDDLLFREATRADAQAYARDIGTDSAVTFRRRLAPRVRCFLVVSGGTITHASWVTTSGAWTREIAAFVTPPEGDAYLYESFTRADARGRGIYPFALGSIVHLMGREGIAELWVATEVANEPSIRALRKAGFAEAFRLPFRRRRGRVQRGAASGPRAAAAGDLITPPGIESRPGG